MMSAETVRKFKRLNQLKKSSALRQGLQAKSERKAKKLQQRNVTIASIITDPSPKAATHYSLKAQACKGDHVFECYSHIELNFIMMGYNVPPSNGNKKKKSKTLADTLRASGEEMPSPNKLSQETYDTIKAPAVRNKVVAYLYWKLLRSTENTGNHEAVTGTVYCHVG